MLNLLHQENQHVQQTKRTCSSGFEHLIYLTLYIRNQIFCQSIIIPLYWEMEIFNGSLLIRIFYIYFCCLSCFWLFLWYNNVFWKFSFSSKFITTGEFYIKISIRYKWKGQVFRIIFFMDLRVFSSKYHNILRSFAILRDP